ncbi:MAG: glycosyltransferase, partial [Bacteroidota bacterium]
GCYVPGVTSILLTHQLHPIFGFQPMSRAYTKYLQRFDEIWVPDKEDRYLSGELSRPEDYQNVHFIGPLSRLHFSAEEPKKRWKSLSLLSGPEPMRSRLEAKLCEQLEHLAGSHLLIRGVPSERSPEQRGNLQIMDFADAAFLEKNLPASEYIICRSGYSTLMDLAPLPDKKLILIPTPGQTEQEYLARTQVQGGDAVAVYEQANFQLSFE